VSVPHPETIPEIEELAIAFYRECTAARKAELISSQCRLMDRLATTGIRRRHPDASASELKLHLFTLRLDRAWMVEAYGWDPALHGR
jgi:hypothetical protein